jgi:hypothetical protein
VCCQTCFAGFAPEAVRFTSPPLGLLGPYWRWVYNIAERFLQSFSAGSARLPEITRFFGIIIRMYAELDAPHHQPHFHAYYQNAVGIYGIDPIELIGGSLPTRQ